jgi:hypothetical protein
MKKHKHKSIIASKKRPILNKKVWFSLHKLEEVVRLKKYKKTYCYLTYKNSKLNKPKIKNKKQRIKI